MVEVIGALALSQLGTATGVAAFGEVTIFGLTAAQSAALAGTVIVTAASVGVALATQPGQQETIDRNDITIKQALPGRFLDFGRVKTGGVLFWYDGLPVATVPDPTVLLVVGQILSCASIQQVEQIWLNDTTPAFTGSPFNQSSGLVATDTWATKIIVETGVGAPTETASPRMQGLYPGVWTDPAFRAARLAYSVMTCQQDTDVAAHHNSYPNGAPTLTAIIKGAKLFDPRNGSHSPYNQDTWSYSDNSALAVLRYVLDPDGWGHTVADYDLPSFIVAANDCDEVIGGEARYRSWGRAWTTEERRSSLDALLAACDGRLIEQPNGTAALHVGKYHPPLFSITSADIIEASFAPGSGTLDRVGAVKPRITLESNNWQETEIEAIELDTPDADQAAKVEDLPLAFCPSATQAQRLAKARLRQLNPEWTGMIRTRLRGLQAMGERFIDIRFDDLEIDSTFEIRSIALNLADYTVSIDVASVEPDRWT